MSFFRRQAPGRGRLPVHDLVGVMARFGRYEYDPHSSDEDPAQIYQNIIAPLYPAACADPAGFVELLAREVSGVGGWAAYGAGHTVWELLSSDQRWDLKDDSSYNAVMDASLEFLRQNGVPPKKLTGYEWDHWTSRGGTANTWIPPRELPARERAFITPLRDNELRPVARLWESADSNVILVRVSPDGRYAAVIDARRSDDDPRRVQSDWEFADDLYGLYARIGSFLQTPPPWHDQELEPFFPLPAPAI
jgi:hypothetical protein